MLADNLAPTIVFIDEAGTATEAESMITITKHATSIRSVVLVGDTKQLHAVVLSARVNKQWTIEDGQSHSGPVCIF